MIGIALLGGGIWAREEHLPAIEQNPLLSLKAVYSRSQKSAEALATLSKDKPDIYFDTPATPEKSLDQLLARSDISAVVIALPILSLPSTVKKALSAGKHVLSEKPISKDVATAKELIAFYQRLDRKPIWAVGENLRFVDAVVYGANKLKEIGGTVTTFHMNKFSMVMEDNKYFNTDWRRVPEYQGGFLLDGGVHFVAGLRYMLAAAGGQEIDPSPVAARTTLLESRLAPVDTVHAVLATKDGSRSGTFSISFGTEFKSVFETQVVTTQGCVTVTPTEVRTTSKNAEETKKFEFDSGVRQEMDAFAKSLEVGTVDPRQTPEMALGDLEILEGMLEMGAKR